MGRSDRHGQVVSHDEHWSQATILWPCGHTDVISLSFLPQQVRARRARWWALADACSSCPGGAHQDLPEAKLENVVPLPIASPAASERKVRNQAELEQALGEGAQWIDLASSQSVTRLTGIDPGVRVDVAPGSLVLVDGPGPVVRVWGNAAVTKGGRAVTAVGGTIHLLGGVAAASDGGTVIASSGRAIVDAGARLQVEDPDTETNTELLKCWALPWTKVGSSQGSRLVLDPPGIMVTHTRWAPAKSLPEDLLELLTASRQMEIR